MNPNAPDPDPAIHPPSTGDLAYQFGRPLTTYVSPQQATRLTIYRSHLYENLCTHTSFAQRSEGNMDVQQCATCRSALEA
jgi:hypothetical protein